MHSRHKIKMLSDVSRSPFSQFEETRIVWFINIKSCNSLAAQWLGLHASTARSTGSIPGQGTTIPQGPCSGAQKKGLGWTPKPPPPTHRHPRYIPKLYKVSVKLHTVLIEDTQLCINSNNFYLEGKIVKIMDRLFLSFYTGPGI